MKYIVTVEEKFIGEFEIEAESELLAWNTAANQCNSGEIDVMKPEYFYERNVWTRKGE